MKVVAMAPVRVLLVEDEACIRFIAAEVLQDEGFEVVEAWDGDEAARLLDGSCLFDVLFTDVQMPGLIDGIDLAMHARQRHPMIHLIVVSSYTLHLVNRLSTLTPTAHIMAKPYRLENIIKTINSLCATACLTKQV